MSTETQDTTETTLDALEAQIVRLPAPAQLQLVARISERLSDTTPDAPRSPAKTYPAHGERPQKEQREDDLEKLLAQLDTAAALWSGPADSTDAAEDIRQMRAERDEQLGIRRKPPDVGPCG